MFDFGGGSDDSRKKKLEEERRKRLEEDHKKKKLAHEAVIKRYWVEKKAKKKAKKLKEKKLKKQAKIRKMLDQDFELMMERRKVQKEREQQSGPSLKRGNASLLSQEIPGANGKKQEQERMGLRGASKLPNYEHESIEDRCGFNASDPASFSSKLRRF